MMKNTLLCLGLMLLCFSGYAQNRADTTVHVAPVQGGDEDARLFFLQNFEMEVGSRSYAVTSDAAAADYTLTSTLARVEDVPFNDAPGEGGDFPLIQNLHLALVDNSNGHVIAEQDMYFEVLEETYDILPLLVFSMIANIPLTKLDSIPSKPIGGGGGFNGLENDPLDRKFYLGVGAGLSWGFYALGGGADYKSAVAQSVSWELSVLAAFRPFSWLSIQAEAVINQDSQSFQMLKPSGIGWITYTERYSTQTLTFPLIVKIPLLLDSFLLSPYGGFYYTLPLRGMSRESNEPGALGSYSYNQPPLGMTAGLEIGFRLGPGLVFLNLRYFVDFGSVAVPATAFSYNRSRFSLSSGYQIGFFQRKKR
ncbi:MAG: hypothetical protein LBQ44_05020 [Treponema sp.]|nr:hypothetical protein [Treponema sp.]